jgi:hypothetical protein
MGGAATLGAAVSSIDTTTNQMTDAMGGDNDDEMRPRRNARGGFFPVFWGGEWGDKRKRERDWASALGGHPLAQKTQQPTNNNTNDGVFIFDEIRPWRNVEGGRYPVVSGDSVSDKNNMKKYTPWPYTATKRQRNIQQPTKRQCQ